MSCPGEKNIKEKEQEKIEKYRSLIFQLRRTYDGYAIHMVPLIIGVLGGVAPTCVQNLKKLDISSENARKIVSKMQKFVILGSLHTLRAHEACLPTT